MLARTVSIFAFALALLGSPLSAVAQPQAIQASSINSGTITSAQPLDRFIPRPSQTTRLDYEIWDALLREMVLYGGPSLRISAPTVLPVVGSRFTHGHTSRYRLEGNRVVFEEIGPEFKGYIDAYVTDITRIANDIDISTLARNEQLSFWMNLHNAVAIQAIADEYPIRRIDRVKAKDGTRFHDTKRVQIDGVDLSLRDIREGIVYRNWSDPLVIYGFFHGDIGSPSIQRKAFDGSNVRETLVFSGDEFVNSLRGFHVDGSTAKVSKIYEHAAPYFFANPEGDLRAHLKSLMQDDVAKELDDTKRIKFMNHEHSVADLTRGEADWRPFNEIESNSGLLTRSIASPLQRAIQERREKMDRVRKRGLFGTVTIEDIETVDPDLAAKEKSEEVK